MTITSGQLAEQLSAQLRGSGAVQLHDVASLERAGQGLVTFAESTRQARKLVNNTPGALITTSEVAEYLGDRAYPLLLVTDPAAAFVQTMMLFRPAVARPQLGISPAAHVAGTASIGQGTNIYPGALIEDHVRIGARCDILPHAVIRAGSVIGDDCTIHPHAVLYPQVHIGHRVTIHANAVIGADGFGYRFVQGAFVRIPHTGTVIIEDDVEIGACATIDRGMVEATVIGRGTKIDNLVMIAHNCQIGKHNAFASQVGFAGSCSTGDYVRCGGQVGVADHLHIGTGASLGGKAGVMSDLDPGGTYYGIPARPEKQAIKQHLSLARMPELQAQVKQLTDELEQLKLILNSSPPAARAA